MPQCKSIYQPIRQPPSRQADKEHGGFSYSVPFLSYPFQTRNRKEILTHGKDQNRENHEH